MIEIDDSNRIFEFINLLQHCLKIMQILPISFKTPLKV